MTDLLDLDPRPLGVSVEAGGWRTPAEDMDWTAASPGETNCFFRTWSSADLSQLPPGSTLLHQHLDLLVQLPHLLLHLTREK